MKTASKIPAIEEQLAALDRMTDDDIDYSDIPETLDWSEAEIGKFYRPKKRPITLRLDADLVEWFKHNHPKYQRAINTVLREHFIANR